MDIKLIQKDEVVEEDEMTKSSQRQNIKFRSNYREVIKSHIPKWKENINESPGEKKEYEIRLRFIRDLMGSEYKEKTDNTIYSRVKNILLENGIKVRLYHHYGARLVMSLVKDECEIISDTEINRINREKTTKRYGFNKYYDYYTTTESYKKKHVRYDKNLSCPKYIGNYLVDKLMKIFDGTEKNPIIGDALGASLWDWRCKTGVIIKHVASCIKYRIIPGNKIGREYDWEGWIWMIFRNKFPDQFLLLGYGDDREYLEIINAWLIPRNAKIRGKQFWDRESFSIRSDNNKQILGMQKYEVGKARLDKIRYIIEQNALRTIRFDEDYVQCFIDRDKEKDQISEWYKTFFR